MLQQLLPIDVFAFMLVFARVGGAIMLLPGIGETYVSPRIRLCVALAMTFLLAPVVAPLVPALPAQPVQTFLLVLGETATGVFIGMLARLTMSALQVAGTVIAFQSGLGFGMFYDPTQGSQGALVSSFLALLGLVMIFVTDLHLLLLRATADSYLLFPPAGQPPFSDFAEAAVGLVAGAFQLGIQIAAPFIVFGLVYYVGLGVLNRLMPQVQVTFLAMPAQITAAFVLLTASLGAAMMWFLDYFEAAVARLLVS